MIHRIRWTADKIAKHLALIESLVYRRHVPLPAMRYLRLNAPLVQSLVGSQVNDHNWETVEPQTYWGDWEADFLMRTRFQVPRDWSDQPTIALYLPIGNSEDFCCPESLAYIDGIPYATCDRYHQEIELPARWRDGQPHSLALRGWTGRGGMSRGESGKQLFMRQCSLVIVNPPTRDFVATARVALGTVNALDDNEPAKGLLLNALNAAFKILDLREPFGDGLYGTIAAAHAALREGIARAGAPLPVNIIATGHAHIDIAWLWTLAQTRRKGQQTFHTVLRLMEQFPDFHFTQSQPQLYEFVKQDNPILFEQIKTRVAEKRWEPIGGMWVEADCNLSGAESLARQLLLGRKFFREHFGADAESPVLWLPDVFGYAWNLPQLIKQAGLDYFFTIKLSWSQYNRLPYDSFWWQGLDGTRVLTHFGTTPGSGDDYGSTYNARLSPLQVIGTWTNFQQKESQHELLIAFGHGDGGGGPTREMLENLRELSAFPGMPQVRSGSVIDFYRRLEAESGPELPVWNGELYLELHRGTYTTQSRNKRANRKSEFLLHDAEFVGAVASLLNPEYGYPQDALTHAWQLVCLNQFHDIIPGSSVGAVYEESQRQYSEIREISEKARTEALAAIAKRIDGDLLIVNPTGFRRRDLAFVTGVIKPLMRADGTPALTQAVEGGTLIDAGELEPYSITALSPFGDAATRTPGKLVATPNLLENDMVRVELNAAGDLVRLYDKINHREVLPSGALANQFQAFEDRPINWDAWDIDIFFDDKLWLAEPAESIRVIESGPLRATLEIHRRILNSDHVQRVSLSHNSPRLDFDTTIDWRERHILLKVAFPVDVLSPVATYEIQWGNVERPTHRNTSWDWARFETCAHKWVDLSEGDYGVSVLNDCKYGHDIRDNVIRISLLRAPTMPDPEADQGEHHFAYSLFPHAGRWNENTIAEAYTLNDPIIAYAGEIAEVSPNVQGPSTGSLVRRAPFSFISSGAPNLVIETIKRAEDGTGIIVRAYESQRRRGNVTLSTGFEIAQAWRTDLLEQNQSALTPEGNSVQITIKPYEIVTLRLIPKSTPSG